MGLGAFLKNLFVRKECPSNKAKDECQDDSALDSYVVLDLETTGLSASNDKIIEVAMLKISNGMEADRFSTFVNPEKSIPRKITELTGITDSDVANAPKINDIIVDISLFISGHTVVGHNVKFDLGFLSCAMSEANIPVQFSFVDTCQFARNCMPGLPNYRLETLISVCNISDQQTHRAMDDVLCTNALYRICLEDDDPQETLGTYTQSDVPHIQPRKSFPESVRVSDIQPKVSEFDRFHPLYGKSIVFTGVLSISRADAMQMAVDVGAVIRSSVSSKTDVIVVGTQDKSLVGSDGLSCKEEKAIVLNESGKANIKMISEAEFISLIGKELTRC